MKFWDNEMHLVNVCYISVTSSKLQLFIFLQAADEDERVLEKISFFQDMLISYRVGTVNRGEINTCTMFIHSVA